MSVMRRCWPVLKEYLIISSCCEKPAKMTNKQLKKNMAARIQRFRYCLGNKKNSRILRNFHISVQIRTLSVIFGRHFESFFFGQIHGKYDYFMTLLINSSQFQMCQANQLSRASQMPQCVAKMIRIFTRISLSLSLSRINQHIDINKFFFFILTPSFIANV